MNKEFFIRVLSYLASILGVIFAYIGLFKDDVLLWGISIVITLMGVGSWLGTLYARYKRYKKVNEKENL